MKWFGASWGAYVCSTTEHAETPLVECTWCGVPIVEGDQGLIMPFHGEAAEPSEVAGHLDCVLSALGITEGVK